MVFFLYAVSGLLVLGGFGLALYGADNIRSDSGAVFAATGVSAAAAGLLLLAMTRVMTELRKIRVALEDGLSRAAAGAFASQGAVVFPEESMPATPPVAPPHLASPSAPQPHAAGPGSQAAAAAAALEHDLDMDEAQRELDLAPPAGAMAASAATAAGAAVAGGLAEQLLQRTRRRIEGDGEAAGASPGPVQPVAQATAAAESLAPRAFDEDDDLLREPDVVATPEPVPASAEADVPSVFADVLDGETAGAEAGGSGLPPPPSTAVEEPAPPQQRAERTLAATYASGENVYYMYSDGTIEAETPIGRFRFVSMDELRVFVETGEGGIPLSPAAPPGAA
ncbi:MAG: hypothetical protein O9972_32930 [Burkholderiales bacterium]|nr:hypothetical protein [Burkholderiales bacterium]